MSDRQTQLQTPRLRLRLPRLDDFDASAAMWADPEVVRHISGVPSTREQSWSRLLRYIGHWSALGFGYWVVEESQSGTFLGEVGLADFHREIAPPVEDPELGWVLASSARGKGFATEAVAAVIDWARQYFEGIDAVACIIAPENAASIRVAEKCGFTLTCETTYMTLPALMYRRPLRR